jgi:hypothetical protein
MEAGIPVLVRLRAPHAVVVSGYLRNPTGPDEVIINDPWVGKYVAPATLVTRARAWWSLADQPDGVQHRAARPRSDEPSLREDSDGDGLVDFDEPRFGTHVRLADSDQDGLDDKTDIRASVMDGNYGYAFGGPGRDVDGDGKAMELDPDSDGGGCLDGLEDHNRNGHYDLDNTWPEQYNFEKSDDACYTGTFELVLEMKNVNEDGDVIHQRHRSFGQGSIAKDERGRLTGTAQLTASIWGLAQNPLCPGDYRYDFEWSADLAGEVHRMGENRVVDVKATPERGPDFLFNWNTSCPGEPGRFEGVPWPGWTATFERWQDEVEQRNDIPMPHDPSIIEFYQRWTMRRVGEP